jgi:PRTRC genetic system protein A
VIPVYLKSADFEEPDCALYYLVAANGLFLVRKTPLFASVTAAHGVCGLEYQTEHVTLRFPKIPRWIMNSIYGFFRAVHQRWDAEAISFLFYNPQKDAFRIGIPRQKLFGSASLRYSPYPRPEGFIKLGDIHSHGSLPAFFSHTDDDDDSEDGLHIVLGELHRAEPGVSVSFVAGGQRFKVRPEHVFESDLFRPDPPPRRWLEKITYFDHKSDDRAHSDLIRRDCEPKREDDISPS